MLRHSSKANSLRLQWARALQAGYPGKKVKQQNLYTSVIH
jgi:hypothetical protein